MTAWTVVSSVQAHAKELSRSSQMQSLAPCRNFSARTGAECHHTSTENRPRFEAVGRRACRMPRGQAIGSRMPKHLPAVILDFLKGVTRPSASTCRADATKAYGRICVSCNPFRKPVPQALLWEREAERLLYRGGLLCARRIGVEYALNRSDGV